MGLTARGNAETGPAEARDNADAGVTTGSLARKLGVSPTTLRSWDRRYGLGPAVRPDGRHRRWSPGDVAMVQEMCRLTAVGMPPAEAARAAKEAARGGGPAGAVLVTRHPADARPAETPAAAPPPPAATASRSATGLPLGDVRQECRGLARAAVRLDAFAVQRQLAAAVDQHGLATAWEEVMVPTLRAVGRKWESSGDRYVEVEHLLSWHVSATLRHVYVAAAGRGRDDAAPPVLLACLPGEPHTLPLEALSAALAERGVPVLMLGGAVPPEALMTAFHRVGPAAVVLWSQSTHTANLPLARHIAAARWGMRGARTQSQVLLSGPGWGRQTGPGLLRPRHLGDALRLITAREG
ncbi:MerR family transcriptional regulator [Streptomyces sp. NPDC048566]|uniref:MerR family transcriptional regulator n=1 Tax=Streptomyces sp. NPDC048566 TaxID=3365569 RepID=UPI00371C4B49